MEMILTGIENKMNITQTITSLLFFRIMLKTL